MRYDGVDNQLEMAGDFKIKYKCAFKERMQIHNIYFCESVILTIDKLFVCRISNIHSTPRSVWA